MHDASSAVEPRKPSEIYRLRMAQDESYVSVSKIEDLMAF